MYVLMLALIGCSQNSSEQSPKPVVEKSKQVVKAPANPTLAVDATKVEKTALSPSPMESRKAAEKEGITTNLGTLIPVRDLSKETKDPDQTALRTGVILADTVLQIKELSKERLLSNLKLVEQNLKQMGAGEGLVFSITELNRKVTNDALTRDELLFELDEIVAYSRPSEGFGKDDNTGPLLQAGSWLASINLIAKAMLKENNIPAANNLFRHEKVAEYFLSYVNVEGKDKIPSSIMTQLNKTLQEMIEISKKTDISKEDVERVAMQTSTLLELI
jgi:hypothetical protein